MILKTLVASYTVLCSNRTQL